MSGLERIAIALVVALVGCAVVGGAAALEVLSSPWPYVRAVVVGVVVTSTLLYVQARREQRRRDEQSRAAQ